MSLTNKLNLRVQPDNSSGDSYGDSSANLSGRKGLGVLGWVPVVWYLALLVGPLSLILVTSVANRGPYGGVEWNFDLENYLRSFDVLYLMILVRSLFLALFTASICFIVGFPVALSIATAPIRIRSVLVFLLAIPFLTNQIIRICALKSIVAFDGPLVLLLEAIGIQVDRFAISQNFALVLVGMVTSYLPFMVFPLYAALERFDFSLVEAALDLGANYRQVIIKVFLPNLRRAITSGFFLVFIPAFGEFVIPDLLGGAKVMLIGNLISEQFLKARDWPFGSALSVVLFLLLSLILLVAKRSEKSTWLIRSIGKSR